MFWGIQIKAGEKSQQIKLDQDLRVSTVALIPSADGSPLDKALLYIKIDGGKQEFLVCVLDSAHPHLNLALEFDGDDNVAFEVRGKGTLHLTGYFMDDYSSCSASSKEDNDMDTVNQVGNRLSRTSLRGD